MSAVHAIGALIVLVVLAGATLLTVGAALRGGAAWVERIRVAVLVAVGAEAAIGAVTYLTGARPNEPLHVVYGLVVLGVLPLANSFASEAPPRPRAWVIAAALGVMLILFWRLASTG